MSICKANKAVSLEVKNFMQNVPDAKEESITDYLVWKWRELDSRFNYINIATFTRIKENMMTGADFELELWVIGQKFHYTMVFQAKKLVKQHDSYITKLNYPAGTQGQLQTLLRYANSQKKLPFYIFYSIPDSNTKTMCRKNDVSETALFMADAYMIKAFADGQHGKRISKNELLTTANPFHCMFCCPLTQHRKYFINYFSALPKVAKARNNERLPNYVNMLLNGHTLKLSKEKMLSLIDKNQLCIFRAVGVYDMRDLEDELKPSFD